MVDWSGRGWNNRLYEFLEIEPEIMPQTNGWLSVWYFVENEDYDQKRFPDNGFIAALRTRRQAGWKLAKVQCGVWASLVQCSIQGEADIGFMCEGDPFRMRNVRYIHARKLSPPLFHDTIKG